MNNIQLCGTVAGRPSRSYDGTALWFNLRARHPPVIPGLPPGIAHVPCRVFRASPERREILLRRKHRNVRVRAVIKASIKKKDRIELSDIVTYAYDIEEALVNDPKKEKYSYIDAATDVSNVCCTLRKYCYNNPKLNFLIPLIPQAGHTMIDPAGFTFEDEPKLATNGRRISSY
jgi:hypothetical protein